jgi:hypothetical protein
VREEKGWKATTPPTINQSFARWPVGAERGGKHRRREESGPGVEGAKRL